jgi:hypothetical protein
MPSSALVLAAVLASALAPVLAVAPARAQMSLDQTCAKFSGKLDAALISGDKVNASKIYTEGSRRVASHFNGVTCPNVKAP